MARERPYTLHPLPAATPLFQRLAQDLPGILAKEGKTPDASNTQGQVNSPAYQQDFRECVQNFTSQHYTECFRGTLLLNAHVASHEAVQLHLLSAQMLLGPYRSESSNQLAPLASVLLRMTSHEPRRHLLMQISLGEAKGAQALALAGDDDQRCQIHFYAAARLLAEGRADEARSEFDACLDTTSECFERQIAAQMRNAPAAFEDKALLSRMAQLNHQLVNLLRTRQIAEAVAVGSEAYELARSHFPESATEFRLGLYHYAMALEIAGEYKRAEPLLLHFLSLARGDPHPQAEMLGAALNGLGLVYIEQGNYAAAESLLREAFEVMQRAGLTRHPSFAQILGNMAEVYRERADFSAALPLYEQALESLRHTEGESLEYARWLTNTAMLYLSIDHREKAEEMAQQALRIRRQELPDGHPDTALSLTMLAMLYLERRQHSQAETVLQESLTILRRALGEQHPRYAITLNNLANVYLQEGRLNEARELLQAARKILARVYAPEHPTLLHLQSNFAILCAVAGQESEALAMLEESLPFEASLRAHLFSISSERQRMALLQRSQASYSAFLTLVRRNPGTEHAIRTAFDQVLQRKAIVAEAQATQRDQVLMGHYQALRPHLEHLLQLRTKIARKMRSGAGLEGHAGHDQILSEWLSERERLEAELARQIPEIGLTQKLVAANRRAIAAALPEDAALVEFVCYHDLDFVQGTFRDERSTSQMRYLAFVLLARQAENIQLVDLGEARTIDRLISEVRGAIMGQVPLQGSRDLSPVEASPGERCAPALRLAIFDPLMSALDGRTHLFLSLDGDLTRLPFEILPLQDGRHMIEVYRVRYLQSGRDLVRFGVQPSSPPSAPCVVADPDFDLGSSTNAPTPPKQLEHLRALERSGLRFLRLPGTRTEGEKVAGLLKVEPLFGAAALKGRIKTQRSPSILHIASHGFFLPIARSPAPPSALGLEEFDPELRWLGQGLDNPLLRSGLALSGANTRLAGKELPPEAEDGILTAEDVAGLDLLNTEMVVLSACETGLGEVQTGEGVFGLQRAFALAGAKTLVMSLWKVPDTQTEEMMGTFYRHLLSGKGRADALREAQLAMKARYREPWYWGAFICQGDPGPLLYAGPPTEQFG